MWLSDLNISLLTERGAVLLSHRDRDRIVLQTHTAAQRVCRELPNLLLILRQGSGPREQRQSVDDSRPTGHGGTNT